MRTFHGIRQLKRVYPKPVIAIGVFDGLHAGHRTLIQKAVRRAKAIGGTSMVMTFHPHPVQVLRPEVQLSTLVSLAYRKKLIKELGVDVCLVVRFTKAFSKMGPEEFVNRYLAHKIKPREVFIGYDFRFGRNRQGDLKLFGALGERFDFKVNMLKAVKSGDKAISSTRIRNLISEGDFADAKKLLGRPVSIMGKVCKGDTRGKRLGFPTANINPNCEVIPPCGVYAVRIKHNRQTFLGMANIGLRPSFKSSNNRLNIEVHIFDFKKNIYGKDIVIEFFKKIRDEKMFNSIEALIKQLKQDEKKARKITASIKD